jgi:hypothetical protein
MLVDGTMIMWDSTIIHYPKWLPRNEGNTHNIYIYIHTYIYIRMYICFFTIPVGGYWVYLTNVATWSGSMGLICLNREAVNVLTEYTQLVGIKSPTDTWRWWSKSPKPGTNGFCHNLQGLAASAIFVLVILLSFITPDRKVFHLHRYSQLPIISKHTFGILKKDC